MYRRVSEGYRRIKPLSKAGNALVTPLVLRVSMGGGTRLPPGDSSSRLPPNAMKKKHLAVSVISERTGSPSLILHPSSIHKRSVTYRTLPLVLRCSWATVTVPPIKNTFRQNIGIMATSEGKSRAVRSREPLVHHVFPVLCKY